MGFEYFHLGDCWKFAMLLTAISGHFLLMSEGLWIVVVVDVLVVVMDVIDPFDTHIGAWLVGEISESIHVIAVGFVSQIFPVNHPFGALMQSIIKQM